MPSGLSGIYLNLKGREGQGIVAARRGRARSRPSSPRGLAGLTDPEHPGTTGRSAASCRARRPIAGPIVAEAPDLRRRLRRGIPRLVVLVDGGRRRGPRSRTT